MFTKNQNSGFTLIELMVTVVVLAIVVTVAIPSFRNIIVSNSVSFDRDELFNLLQFARSEAIKSGTSATVCKSSNGTSCDSGLSWNGGWLVFADTDRDGTLDSGEKILKSVAPLDGQVSVSHSGGDDVVTFESRGLLLDGDGTFTFSHTAGAQFTKTVVLGVTGRATKG